MNIEETGAPLRHQNTKLLEAEQASEWNSTLIALKSRLSGGLFAALVGPSGPGKTQMGVELIRATIESGAGAKYATASRFFLDLKATYVKNSEQSELDVIIRYAKPTMLVLDELGKRKGTEWEDSLLYELLDKRYGAMKDTLLISNETEKSFCDAIGNALVSRMSSKGCLIIANWPAFI